MMDNKDKPIYPVLNNRNIQHEHWHKGLTKREYFAAMAMQGLVQKYPPKLTASVEIYGAEMLAKMSLDCADALLNELDKKDR